MTTTATDALAWAAAQARMKALAARRVARKMDTAAAAKQGYAEAERLEAYARAFDELATKDTVS